MLSRRDVNISYTMSTPDLMVPDLFAPSTWKTT